MKNVLGIIPARGGSKGVKRKNLAKLGGKPLIDYTIHAAKKSELLSEFIVSSDDQEIISHCKSLGVSAPFTRPAELSTDYAPTLDVILHAVSYFESHGKEFHAVMVLQPTTPFRTSEVIDQALEIFFNSGSNSIVSIVDVGPNHPHRMYTLDEKKHMSPIISSDDPMLARQKLPKFYIRSGDIYLISVEELKRTRTLIGEAPLGLILDADKTVNIDTEMDLALAETVLGSL